MPKDSKYMAFRELGENNKGYQWKETTPIADFSWNDLEYFLHYF